MGTRGFFGFYYKKKYYLIYNHYDSYFSFLGNKLLEEIKKMLENDLFEEWLTKFLNVRFYYENSEKYVTIIEGKKDEIEDINEDDFYVQEQSFELLLNTNKKVIIDDNHDINEHINNIFIEYMYILNFDDKSFDVYNHESGKKTYFFKFPDELVE
jgi:hypothetical protein